MPLNMPENMGVAPQIEVGTTTIEFSNNLLQYTKQL